MYDPESKYKVIPKLPTEFGKELKKYSSLLLGEKFLSKDVGDEKNILKEFLLQTGERGLYSLRYLMISFLLDIQVETDRSASVLIDAVLEELGGKRMSILEDNVQSKLIDSYDNIFQL